MSEPQKDWDIHTFKAGSQIFSTDGYETFLWEVKGPVTVDYRDKSYGKPTDIWHGLHVKLLKRGATPDGQLPFLAAGYILCEVLEDERVLSVLT